MIFILMDYLKTSLSLSCRPLHIAARKGLATVVQVLLSRGAAVMALDEEGKQE